MQSRSLPGPGRGASREREEALARLLRRQHGVVARRQLLELGLGSGAIKHRLATRRLIGLHPGVYSVTPAPPSIYGHWMAATLACSAALLSHRSAAALWGLMRPAGPVHITVAVPPAGPAGIVVHRARSLAAADRATRNHIPVTAVPRTLLDLAESESTRTLRRTVEEADRLGLLHLTELEATLARSPGRRGLPAIRNVLAGYTLPPGTRSELEDRFLDLCREAGLPAPEANVVVEGFEVDAFWPDARLVVELDGYAFHRSRDSFERDHARTTVLQNAGFRVRRFTWVQVTAEPTMVIATVRRGLAEASC